jgi:predicted nucleic acid-binding protein
MALGLEHVDRVVLLDDTLARRVARAAGLSVRGTLGLLLDAKQRGIVPRIEPLVDALGAAGMWISPEIRSRILALASESSHRQGE